jgi:hypothetical protein
MAAKKKVRKAKRNAGMNATQSALISASSMLSFNKKAKTSLDEVPQGKQGTIRERLERFDKVTKPSKKQPDWREHIKHMKMKYVFLASISFALLIALGFFLLSSGTKSEADLPVPISEAAKTQQMKQTQSVFVDPALKSKLQNETSSSQIASVAPSDTSEVGVAMIKWMNLIVFLIVLGMIIGFITQMSRRFT